MNAEKMRRWEIGEIGRCQESSISNCPCERGEPEP